MAISTRRPVKAPCELLHTVIGSWSACQFPQTRNVQEQDPVPSGKYVRQQWEIRMPLDAGRVLIHVPHGCFREKDLLQHQEERYCTLCANAKVLTLTSRKKGFINSESNANQRGWVEGLEEQVWKWVEEQRKKKCKECSGKELKGARLIFISLCKTKHNSNNSWNVSIPSGLSSGFRDRIRRDWAQ